MNVLLDHCVPRQLRGHLAGHDVETAYQRGWASYKNGDLLAAAEAAGFTVLLTTDQNIPHQQAKDARRLAIVVLVARSNRLSDLLPLIPNTLAALDTLRPGQIVHVRADAA